MESCAHITHPHYEDSASNASFEFAGEWLRAIGMISCQLSHVAVRRERVGGPFCLQRRKLYTMNPGALVRDIDRRIYHIRVASLPESSPNEIRTSDSCFRSARRVEPR